MTDETKKNETANEPFRAKTTPQNQLSKIMISEPCSVKCRVCQSENLQEIQRLRNSGLGLHDLSSEIKNKFGENFSKDALHRHFKKIGKRTLAVSAEKMLAEFDEKTETLARHQKQTLFVMNKSFTRIMELIEAGALTPTIAEWLALQKHYYQVLQDPNHGNNDDVVAIFQRAAEKHGFSLDQAVLFKTGKRISDSD